MIEVTIKLIPFGHSNGARDLATMSIANDGTGTNELGNYNSVVVYKEPTTEKKVTIVSRIIKHPRELNVLYLVKKVLEESLKNIDLYIPKE